MSSAALWSQGPPWPRWRRWISCRTKAEPFVVPYRPCHAVRPGLLIGLSPKYQQPGQVDWRHGYIPQTVESYGVGLMALAVLVVLLRWARGKAWWPKRRTVLYTLLAVCMAGSGGLAARRDPLGL